MKKFVALKLLPQEKTSDAAAVARFNREMEAVGALRHPHIIEAHDAGEENGTHYLVMDYVEGIELAALSKTVGQFPIADACELMRQTSLGLQHAFEHGLVHRDIKPSNLLLSTNDLQSSRSRETSVSDARILASSATTCTLKILELGLALLHGDQPGAELTSTGQVMGTLDYIAPEQLADTHAVDIRADLYSLGCTLFRLLTTEPPFASPSLNTAAKKMYAHSFTPAPKLLDRRPDSPAELSALVARLLEKKPDARFATPHEVASALAPFCVGHNLPPLLASGIPAPLASDPFAATVLPVGVRRVSPALDQPTNEPRALPAANEIQSGNNTPHVKGSRATEPLLTEPHSQGDAKVDRSLRDRNASSHGVTRLLSRRPLLIAAAILAIILLSVFLPPFLKRDASLTETTTPPGLPNSKSQTPTDPDRAAAEWVLSLKSPVMAPVVSVMLPDGSDKTITNAAELPTRENRLRFTITIVAADGVDDEAVAKYLGPMTAPTNIRLQDCPQITDKSLSVLQRSPMLSAVYLLGSSRLTSKGVLTLAQYLPLQCIGIDGLQFSPELATWLARTPGVTSIHLFDGNDVQLRLLLDATHLDDLLFSLRTSQPDTRHSTWARLPGKLPNLRALDIGYAGLQDADLAVFNRLPKLEILALAGNRKMSDAGLAELATAAKLNFLNVTQTAVTPLGLADFLESHPACQVLWDGADHRAVAEWVLSVGGKVQVAGRGAEWLSADKLAVAEVARLPKSSPASDTVSTTTPESELSRVRLPGPILRRRPRPPRRLHHAPRSATPQHSPYRSLSDAPPATHQIASAEPCRFAH